MPVLKIKNNGIWTETISAISDADTLDGKHADAFALAIDLKELQTLVGDESVENQLFTLEQKVSQTLTDYATKAEIPSIEGLASEDYVDEKIAAIPTPDVSGQINAHNNDLTAHDDIRILIEENTNAIELLTNGASPEEIDSINDLIQYVKEHGSEVTSMKADIKANTNAIADKLSYNEQTLTEEQKAQVRENIEAMSMNELDNLATKGDVINNNYIIFDAYSDDGINYTGTIQNLTELKSGQILIMSPRETSNSRHNIKLNINELGAKSIYRRCSDDSSLAYGLTKDWLKTGTYYIIMYNSSYFEVINMQKPVATDLTGTVPISNGGTGATTAAEARVNLGITPENIGALPSDTVIPSIEGLASESYVDSAIAAIPQSDYGQNDDTQLDYIKNRLAWTDNESEILIPKQSFTFENGSFQTTIPEGTVICELGKRYIVTWEDKSYNILCKELFGNLVGGNQSLIGGTSLENTQEPFFFGYNPNSNIMMILTNMPDGIYEIELKTDPIHKIDSKYYEQPYCSEYFDPIDLTIENNCSFPPESELIGSKITTYYSNKVELKLSPIEPDAESIIYSDSNLLQIGYSTNGMTDIPVLFVSGPIISYQMGEFDEKYDYIGLVYCYEKTKILFNSKEYDKGWYYFRATSDSEIFLANSWDPKKDPVYFYLKDECIVSPLILQMITLSSVTSYIITKDNLISSGDVDAIGNFNSFFLSNLNYNKIFSNNFYAVYTFSDFIFYNNNYELYSTHGLKNSALGGQVETILIEPIKKLKKIESQYIPYIQSNWNQNDETKSDYIKNRFGGWSEYERNDILRVLESDFVVDDYSNGMANLSIDLKLEENKTYEVQYATDSYTLLPCKRYDNTLYLGNYSLYDSDTYLGSEYPFVVISNDIYSCWIYNQYTGDGADFTITLIDEIVHEIPEKYIKTALDTKVSLTNEQIDALLTLLEEG